LETDDNTSLEEDTEDEEEGEEEARVAEDMVQQGSQRVRVYLRNAVDARKEAKELRRHIAEVENLKPDSKSCLRINPVLDPDTMNMKVSSKREGGQRGICQ
jgi:hypothetical protein